MLVTPHSHILIGGYDFLKACKVRLERICKTKSGSRHLNISRANFGRGSRALVLFFRSEGSRRSGPTAPSRFSHKCPVQNRIKITSMITLTPLMGTKPHFLLCGQIGRLPTSATRTNTASTAIRNIAFLLFFNRPDLGCISGTTEGRTSLRSRLTSRFRAADKSPGTGFH
jgi:hypothetical protein